MGDHDARLADLARLVGMEELLRLQDGVIARCQALAVGLTRARIDDLVRRGVWIRALPGTYVVDCDARSGRTRVRAAWLWAGAGAVLAGSAAAWWHGLTTGMPRYVEVFVPPGRSRPAQPGVRLIRSVVPDPDVTVRVGLRLTTVPRTCLDLARWKRYDLLDVALRTRSLVTSELEPSLRRSRRRRGQVRARAAAASAARNPWSRAELLAQRVFTDAGLTGWVANARAAGVPGKILPDIAFEDLKIAVEIDSRRFHDEAVDPEAFENDHRRQLELARAGWFVIRVTVRQLRDEPGLVVAAVRAVIADRAAA